MLRFKEITLMLDCGLITQTVLSFMPLSLVPSARLNNLPNWTPHNCTDPRLEGVSVNCNFENNLSTKLMPQYTKIYVS